MVPPSDAIVEHFAAVRLRRDLSSPYLAVYNSCGGAIAGLYPLTRHDATDSSIVESLTEWRRRESKWFFTQFEPTPERTRNWILSSLLPDTTKILFLIRSAGGELYGHYGIRWAQDNVLELDNAIRGISSVPERLFHFVEIAILRWAFECKDVEKVIAQVFFDNIGATMMHRGVGLVAEREYESDVVKYTGCGATSNGREFKRVRVLSISRDDFEAQDSRLSDQAGTDHKAFA